MSFESCWAHLGQMVGKTMVTLDRNNAFEIVSLDEQSLVIKPLTSKERVIQRTEVDDAWRELIRQGEISESAIRTSFSAYNPTYVAAILAAVPDVTYSGGPMKLFYGNN